MFSGDGREGEFGEGFRDADYGFELADRDGNAGAGVRGDFGRVDLPADGDEVGRELFAGFGGEAGRAASERCLVSFVVHRGRRNEEFLTICNS